MFKFLKKPQVLLLKENYVSKSSSVYELITSIWWQFLTGWVSKLRCMIYRECNTYWQLKIGYSSRR